MMSPAPQQQSVPPSDPNPYPTINDSSQLSVPTTDLAFLQSVLPSLPPGHSTAAFIERALSFTPPPPDVLPVVAPLVLAIKLALGSWHSTPTINHASALSQCGEDLSFLRELLIDLHNECSAHLATIDGFLSASPGGVNMKRVQELSHAVKGAAANLVCERLWKSAAMVEEAAKACRGEVIVGEMGRVLGVALEDFRRELKGMGLLQ